MNEQDAVMLKWEEVKLASAELELDIQKNAKGNAAAGVRTRKGLRALRKVVTEIVKLTVAHDKERKAVKQAARLAAKAAKAAATAAKAAEASAKAPESTPTP